MFDSKLQHVSRKVKATAELNARLQYEERFSLECDWGHAKWNDYLRDLIKYNLDELSPEEETRQKIDDKYKEIMYNRVYLQDLKSIEMTLEITSGLNYDDDRSDFYDNWSESEVTNENNEKCCPIVIIASS